MSDIKINALREALNGLLKRMEELDLSEMVKAITSSKISVDTPFTKPDVNSVNMPSIDVSDFAKPIEMPSIDISGFAKPIQMPTIDIQHYMPVEIPDVQIPESVDVQHELFTTLDLSALNQSDFSMLMPKGVIRSKEEPVVKLVKKPENRKERRAFAHYVKPKSTKSKRRRPKFR